MRSAITLGLVLLLCAAEFPIVFAQERNRRVEVIPPKGSASQSNAPENSKPNQNEEQIGQDDVVRVDTALVTVPVSITDRNGRYIADLKREDLHVFEDNVEQDIAYFASVDKAFTVVLMVDTSTSTWSKLGQIREAAKLFVDQLRPDDNVMVVSFARGFTIESDVTNDRAKIRKGIERIGRGLSTHLYDAVEKLMQKHLTRIPGRKAVVLFTDGVDATSNHATYEGTVHSAEELDALIYPILYDTYDPAADNGQPPAPPPDKSRLPSILRKLPLPFPDIFGNGGSSGGTGSTRAEYDRGERYLRDLAERTGGRLYEANKDLSALQAAFGFIAEELRRQYTIGYYPKKKTGAGERRQIKVRTDIPNVAVRARDSYIYQGAAATQRTAKPDEPGKHSTSAPVLQKKPFTNE
ncbi:MAG: VWA domain-containing protein [Pyrinomonadaceae bacterium]